MLLRSTLRVGLVVTVMMAIAPLCPVTAAPRKVAKPAARAASRPTVTAGRTPTETVSRLIAAMRRRDKQGISEAFNWNRFADEMNKLIPDGKTLNVSTYKTLLVETLNVEESVSKDLRVGQETKKGPSTATVEMRRLVHSAKNGPTQIKTINVLTLGKEKDNLWRIYRLDSAGQTVPTAKPMAPHAPQGMVPAAGSDRK